MMASDYRVLSGHWKPVVVFFTLMGGIGATFPVHNAYESTHREWAKEEAQKLIVAQTERLEQKINDAQKTADSTARKVDDLTQNVNSIQISSTIAAISSLRMELERHLYNEKNTVEWRQERDRLRYQIERAEEYKGCLIDQRRNCDIFKPW